MAHFKTDVRPGMELPEEAWKGIQQHLGLTDEEFAEWRKDPKRRRYAPLMGAPEIQNKTLVIEVVDSHGCMAGMKVGDKLYFTQACGRYDAKRSSPWCSYALTHLMGITNSFHVLYFAGKDPNSTYWDHFSCADCGSKYGWGQVIMKSYVIDEGK